MCVSEEPKERTVVKNSGLNIRKPRESMPCHDYPSGKTPTSPASSSCPPSHPLSLQHEGGVPQRRKEASCTLLQGFERLPTMA